MITIGFGPGNSKTRDLAACPTTEAVRRSRDLQMALGFDPAAVGVMVNGTIAQTEQTLNDGDLVTLFTKANTKA